METRGTDSLAMIALVHTALVRTVIAESAVAIATRILSSEELQQFASTVTRKRRVELLAGRLAAKIACLSVRLATGRPLHDLIDLSVRRNASGRPECIAPDHAAQRVSIAHSGDFAVAIAAAANTHVGIDVEPAGKRLPPSLDEYLHPLELRQRPDGNDACRRWTIREAWGKLSGRGIATDFASVATLESHGCWWLALPATMRERDLIATASNESLTLAVAIRR